MTKRYQYRSGNNSKLQALRQLALVLIMLCYSYVADAVTPKQPKMANRVLLMGGGYGNAGFRDQLQSPRIYQGGSFSFSAGYEKLDARRIKLLDLVAFTGTAGNQLSGSFGSNSASVMGLQYTGGRLWRIRLPLGRWQWYAGPAIQLYTQLRTLPDLGNSSLGYDFYAGLGGVSRLEFPLYLKSDRSYKFLIFRYTRRALRPIRLGWQLELPLAGLHTRSPFAGVTNTIGNDPVDGLLADLMDNSRFKGPGSYLYLRNHFYGHYFLKNGNALTFGWQWAGYAYNYESQPTRSSNGQILLGLRIKLDKNGELRK